VLKVVLPETLILGTVHVFIDSTAVCLIVCPVAVIDVAIYVDESSLAVGSVFSPFSRVLCTVRPCLLSESITEATFPLASIDSAGFELVRLPRLAWLIRIVEPFRDGFTCFFLREVLAASQLFGSQQGN